MALKSLLDFAPFFVLAAAIPQAQVTDPADADDVACVSSWRSFDSNSVSFEGPDGPKETQTTGVFDTTITDKNVPITTLCGKPRALAPYPVTTTVYTETFDPPRTIGSQYTSPRPECTINPKVCESVHSDYDQTYTSWISSGGPSPTEYIHCTTTETITTPEPAPTTTDYVSDCGTSVSNCYIYGGGYNKLYYWPVTTVDGDFCAQNGSTITPTPTIDGVPNTAVIDGFTFTSPTNYFSVENVYPQLHGTRRRQLTSCGPTATPSNVIVPLVGDFSSFRGNAGASGTFSFNFHDLQTPVPAPAYEGQRRCRGGANSCATIPFGYGYVPQVQMPTQVINLMPEWVQAGCIPTATGLQVTEQIALGPTVTAFMAAETDAATSTA